MCGFPASYFDSAGRQVAETWGRPDAFAGKAGASRGQLQKLQVLFRLPGTHSLPARQLSPLLSFTPPHVWSVVHAITWWILEGCSAPNARKCLRWLQG